MARRFRGRWLDRPWGRMRVWEAGTGPPVVAVHGLGGSGRYWQGLADEIGDRHRVLAPDLAGFGRSDAPAGDHDRAGHLADLDAVVEELGDGGRVVVAGHSLGGVLAALWASANPGHAAGSALAATPFPSGRGPDFRAMADGRSSAGRRLAGRLIRAVWPVVAAPIGIARRYPPEVVLDFGRQTLRGRAWTMWSLFSDPSLPATLGTLRGLASEVPTLVLNAEDDRRVPIRDQRRWVELIPGAERVTVPEGGHQFLLRTRFAPLAGWLGSLPTQEG